MRFGGGRVEALDFGGETVALGADDAVILAVPPYAATALVGGLEARRSSAPSSTRISASSRRRAAADPRRAQRHGRVDFRFSGPVSVTISAGDRLIDASARGAGEDDLARGRARRPDCPPRCRPGRSCGSAAPPSPPRRSRTPNARVRRRHGAISCSPAIGPTPVCPLPSRARSAPATAPLNLSWNSDDARDRRSESSRRPRRPTSSTLPRSTAASQSATQALIDRQRPDGHWVFELEADATIPAEYVLLRHYLGEPIDAELEAKNRGLSAPHSGRSRRLAAVSRRRRSTSARP